MNAVGLRVAVAGAWASAFIAVSLGTAPSVAQQSDSQSAGAAAPTAPEPPSEPAFQRQRRDLDAKLAEARRRLEEAARQVAELSAELGADARTQIMMTEQRFGRGVIGVQLDPASGPEGARVLDVSPGGPAAEAGVRAGDVIVAVNGTSLAGDDAARKLVERMRGLRPDEQVKLSIKRDGKLKHLELTTRPSYFLAFGPFGGPGPVVAAPVPPGAPAPPGMPRIRDWVGLLSDQTEGMELAKLTPALGWYFGTDKGVLVLRASDNDAFGLKDGDVILSIDGREPQSGAHATRILRSYQPGERITLKIMRRKQPMSLAVTLPHPDSHREGRGPVAFDFTVDPREFDSAGEPLER
ncbi:MAG TPA: PDZ domain-containing protein [Steroidobacteraceae bacterium]|nr:PDZ domain-containing protein [Steroidobacteraceae bacterium]